MNIAFNKKKLLFTLIFIWIIILSLRLTIFGPKQIHIPLQYKPRDKNILFKEAKHEDMNIPELKLNQLNKQKIKYQENFKNIFKSIIIPPVKYIPQPAPPKPAPPPPSIPKYNPLEDELKKFQFIGFSEKKGKTNIFLSKGDNLYVVSKGEKIEDKFLVKNITQTEIILTIINQTDVEIKLSLKEEQGGSSPTYQNPPPISYPEIYEPPVMEEPPLVPEEIPENPPAPPPPGPPHRPPQPSREEPPSESEF